ncbi:MAG: hypothetical protein HOO96_13825 [Polyangiaceae bacterium]|nr:hypothetical protein [Polyangiaceae bacterium]
MSSLGKRLAVTSVVVLGVLALRRIPPAGIDLELRGASAVDLGLSIGSLGIGPAIWAYLLVELVAIAVPALRPLREDPRGRAKLERAVGFVFVGLAVLQAASATLGVEATLAFSSVEPPSRLLLGTSLTGGCLMLFLLARWATRSGLTNGILTVATVVAAGDVVRVLTGPMWFLGRVYVAIVFVLFATVAGLATWLAVRKLGPSDLVGTEPTGRPYRGSAKDAPAWAPVVPTPTSTLLPFAAATFVVRALSTWDVRVSGLLRAAIVLGVSLVLTPLLGRLLQRPDEIAATLRKLGAEETQAGLEAQARTRLQAAERTTMAYFFALAIAVVLAEMTRETRFSMVMFPLAVAVLMDTAAAFSLHRRARVCVMEARRTHQAMAMVQALGNHGIRAIPAGVAANALLQVLAPFAPVTLWVAPEDAAEALAFVEAHRAANAKDLAPPDTRVAVPAGWAPRKRFRALVTVVCTMVAVGMVLGASELWQARHQAPARPGVTLEVSAVDDESEWVEGLPALEPGTTVERENTPLGRGPGTHVTLRFALRPGESAEAARHRATAWLSAQQPPAGGRFALVDEEDFEAPDVDAGRVVALRAVVLTGEPILTARDVESATAVSAHDGQDAQVMVSLTREGATRFEGATDRLVRRRVAILTSGVVRSLPVVLSKISGGRLFITVGRGNPDVRYGEAQELARALGGD